MNRPGFGQNPHRFRLLDSQLHLDPQIESEMRRFSQGEPVPQVRQLFLQPAWSSFPQSELSRIMSESRGAHAPVVPRGSGPPQLRPGEATDVLRALYAVPAVQEAVRQVLDQASDHLRRQWAHATPGARAAAVSGTALITAGALAGVLSHSDTRRLLLDAISNADIPVPGVPGLSIRVSPHPGNYGATITFDIQEFLQSLPSP